jgi:transmembrane sensor
MNRPPSPPSSATGSQDDLPENPDLAALLYAAGPRECAPDAVEAEVRAAVAAEWRATVATLQRQEQQRRRRRLVMPGLAAAAAATLAVAVWIAQPLKRAEGPPIASVAMMTGSVQVRHGDDNEWTALGAADTIRAGDALQTPTGSRVALRWPNGMEVRLDDRTAIVVADAGSATLDTGAVYVDSGSAAPSRDVAFVLQTPAGQVRHLGTQYAVRSTGSVVEVSVREGLVAIDRRGDRVIGNAGEQLSLRPDGNVTRTRLPAHDAQWAWVQSIIPPFEIENRPLDEFLTWAARQTGRKLVYASRAAADMAGSVRLKGSVAGLPPDAAVQAVLATTPSLQVKMADSQIRVEPASR